MTQEEILQYNKRCAEFLDIVTEEPHWVEFNKFMPNSIAMSYGRRHHIEQLQFHSDWNWIMEVVEAIENLLDGTRPFKYGKLDDLSFNIGNESVKVKASFWTNPNTVDGNYWSYFKYNKKFDKVSKKEAVVQAINQFLIWYEQNK